MKYNKHHHHLIWLGCKIKLLKGPRHCDIRLTENTNLFLAHNLVSWEGTTFAES